MNFYLDQRPETCLHSLALFGFIHNFYHHQSIKVKGPKWSTHTVPYNCGLFCPCMGRLLYLSESHITISFVVSSSPELLIFRALLCPSLLPLISGVFWLPNQVSLILIPCQSQWCWAMDAHPNACTSIPWQLKLFLFKQNCDFIEFLIFNMFYWTSLVAQLIKSPTCNADSLNQSWFLMLC